MTMTTTHKISLAALAVSIASALVMATYYVTSGLVGLDDLAERVGDPKSRTGVYGEIYRLSTIPVGTILPWIPTEAQSDVPDGWTVCDGTNQTPNLSGVFLRGVTSRDKSRQLGGRATIPDDGSHSHKERTGNVYSNRITYNSGGSDNNGVWFNHGHEILSDGSHNHGGDNLPPYYSVIYIMKVK